MKARKDRLILIPGVDIHTYVTVHDEPGVKSHIADQNLIIIPFTRTIIAKFSGS